MKIVYEPNTITIELAWFNEEPENRPWVAMITGFCKHNFWARTFSTNFPRKREVAVNGWASGVYRVCAVPRNEGLIIEVGKHRSDDGSRVEPVGYYIVRDRLLRPISRAEAVKLVREKEAYWAAKEQERIDERKALSQAS
jgi:hypothetical protein